MSEHNRDRSVSGGADVIIRSCPYEFVLIFLFQDSDFESQIGDTNQPGKPGRKKKAKQVLLSSFGTFFLMTYLKQFASCTTRPESHCPA